MCVAACVALCVALCVAVCVAVCIAACVAVHNMVARLFWAVVAMDERGVVHCMCVCVLYVCACVAVCAAVCVPVCVAVSDTLFRVVATMDERVARSRNVETLIICYRVA